MIYGILAGVFWALETVILGIALRMTPMVSTEQAVFLAPFVSTFLHDLSSALWSAGYNLAHGDVRKVFRMLGQRSGRRVALAAVIGGPVGMTGYVMAIKYMGASVGAVASAVFPAIGAVLAFIFLKEKMQWYRWVLLVITLFGVFGLSYSPELSVSNFWLGFLGAMMCSFGWGIEAVLLASCFKHPEIKREFALQIRQATSALVYGAVLLPVLHGWGFTLSLFSKSSGWVLPTIALAALCATVSYLCYYKAIAKIGASKAMSLDITYVAWAIAFNVVLTGDTSSLTPVTVLCALIVIVCGVLAGSEFKKSDNVLNATDVGGNDLSAP